MHLNAEPAPPALLFIHGDFGDGHDSWGPVVGQIGGRYQTVIVNRPGFGNERSMQGRFTFEGDARHTLHVADELGIGSYHLVGHSYGGIVAIEAARLRPEAVCSLHLIEPPLLRLLPDEPEVTAMDRRVRQLQADHAGAGADKTTAAFFGMLGADHVVERLRGSEEWERLRGYADRFARNEPPGDYPLRHLDALPAAPIVVYTGGRSHPALRAIARALAQRPEVTRLVEVAGAGHAVQMAGAAFLDPLMDMVAEADAVGRTPAARSGAGGTRDDLRP